MSAFRAALAALLLGLPVFARAACEEEQAQRDAAWTQYKQANDQAIAAKKEWYDCLGCRMEDNTCPPTSACVSKEAASTGAHKAVDSTNRAYYDKKLAFDKCRAESVRKDPKVETAIANAANVMGGGMDAAFYGPNGKTGAPSAADSSVPTTPSGGKKPLTSETIHDPEDVEEPPVLPADKPAHDAKVEENKKAAVNNLGARLAEEPPGGSALSPKAVEQVNKLGDAAAGLGQPDPFALNGYGRFALNANDPARAERLASAAIQSDGSNADSFGVRGAARLSMGNLKGAKDDAKKALALDPSNAMGKTLSQFVQKQEADPSAKPPDPSKLIRGFGGASAGGLGGGRNTADSGGVGVGKGPAGMIGAERAGGASFATMTPSNRLAAQAESMVKIGDVKGALKQATQAIEADKSNPEAYAVRAGIWNKSQRYLLAQQDANSALGLDPGHAKALNARAFAFNMTGHPQEAMADAEKALAANPKDALGYLNLAMSQDALGEPAKANENYKKAAKLDPSMKVFYDEFLSKHPELNEGGAGGGSMAVLPPALRSAKGAGAAALAVLGLGAAAFALRRRRAPEEDEEEPAPAQAPAPAREPVQGAETVRSPERTQLIAGNYEVRKELGRGGMGVVYEAFDNSLGRKVAIKEMRAEIAQSARDKERFLSEARTVAKFQHPNIVAIYAILEDQGRAFLVFEHVEGGGLDKILDQHRRLPAESAVPLLKGIASALDYSHSRKVIHRDLKPSNIMITSDGIVKVMDFGIAHEAKQTVSRLTNAEAFGTMAYMPPEQELGQASKESDVFAFAVLAYETMVGAMPFPGPNYLAQKKGKLFKAPSQADPAFPAALDAVFEKALDPEPGNRHHSAGEFADALARAL